MDEIDRAYREWRDYADYESTSMEVWRAACAWMREQAARIAELHEADHTADRIRSIGAKAEEDPHARPS